jgi:hypothetical protein
MYALRTTLALVTLLLLSPPSPAQFAGNVVVQVGVTYPGVGTVTQLPGPPSIAGGTIAFPATTSTTGPGIQTATGGTITTVASFATPVPGGSGNFTAFGAAQIGLSSSGVAFGGNGNPGPANAGIYSNVTGSLAAVVNNSTPFPTGGTFTGFSVPSVSGTTVAFGGTNSGPGTVLGVFTKTGSGSLVTIASTATTAPAGGNFTTFVDPANGPTVPAVSGSNVVFNAETSGGRFGVYASIGGTITTVADNTITPPGGTGSFSSFGFTPMIDGSRVAFYGASSGRSGIYTWSAGTITRVADTTTTAPGGGTFTSFLNNATTPPSAATALSGGHVVFRATTSLGVAGVYTDLTGTLTKVIATSDTVNGETVNSVNIGDYSYTGGSIAVLVGFTNGSFAVCTFQPVPEPTGLIALGAAGLVAVRVRRRGRPTVRSVL